MDSEWGDRPGDSDMPGEPAEPTDIGIEPSVRPIARLGPSIVAGPREHVGILPPFSGLLRPTRSRQSGRPRPPLSYLTLQSLVVEHVSDRAERGTGVETAERAGGTDQAGDGDDDTAPDAAESTTVREFFRQQLADEDGDVEFPGFDRRTGGPGDASLTLPDLDLVSDDGDRREGALDRTPGEVDRRMTGRDRPPGAGPIGGEWSLLDTGQRASGGESPTDQSGTHDTGPRGGEWSVLDPGNRSGEGGSSADRSGSEGAAPTGPSVGPPDPADGGQTELVVLDRSLPPGVDRGAGGPSSPGQSDEPAGLDGTAGDPRRDHGSARTSPLGGRGQAGSGEGEPSTAARATPARRDQADSGVDLAAALDDVPRPTLDRFVDRLSDELERHERIERERRGR